MYRAVASLDCLEQQVGPRGAIAATKPSYTISDWPHEGLIVIQPARVAQHHAEQLVPAIAKQNKTVACNNYTAAQQHTPLLLLDGPCIGGHASLLCR
jgi:hypothetical protein